MSDLQDSIDVVERSALGADDKTLLVDLLRLLALRAEQMTADQLRQARVAAGLSLGQAARLLWISRDVLVEIEAGFPNLEGIDCWQPGLWARMNYVYGLGDRK